MGRLALHRPSVSGLDRPRHRPLRRPRLQHYERDRILSAMRQWNYVLNGFVQFRARAAAGRPAADDAGADPPLGRLGRGPGRQPPSDRPAGRGHARARRDDRQPRRLRLCDQRPHRQARPHRRDDARVRPRAGRRPRRLRLDGAGLQRRRWAVASTTTRWRWWPRRSACRSTSSTGASARAARCRTPDGAGAGTAPMATIARRWRRSAERSRPGARLSRPLMRFRAEDAALDEPRSESKIKDVAARSRRAGRRAGRGWSAR